MVVNSFSPICVISTYFFLLLTFFNNPDAPPTVLVIIAVSTVAICQLTRKEPDLRNIEPESGVRSDKHWPASILNKRRRRRKKSRKKKAKDPDMTTIESEEIEVIEFEEEDIAMDGVGTVGVSDSGRQVDVPKVSGFMFEFCA